MLNVFLANAAEAEDVAEKAVEISVGEAGLVAVQGILVVFSVLIILMIVLYIMKLFSKEEPKKEAAPAVSAAPAAAQSVTTDETIAVICSAVGAMSGDDPTKRLRVVSIQEQSTGKYVWKK